MDSVRAFQPRKISPPHFVAEAYEDLAGMVGGFVGAEQCDGCGNSTYQIHAYTLTPEASWYTYRAVCAVDPTDSEEFKHPEPCGESYPIGEWDPDEVVF